MRNLNPWHFVWLLPAVLFAVVGCVWLLPPSTATPVPPTVSLITLVPTATSTTTPIPETATPTVIPITHIPTETATSLPTQTATATPQFTETATTTATAGILTETPIATIAAGRPKQLPTTGGSQSQDLKVDFALMMIAGAIVFLWGVGWILIIDYFANRGLK